MILSNSLFSSIFLYFITLHLEYTVAHQTSGRHSICFSLQSLGVEGRKPALEAILEIKLRKNIHFYHNLHVPKWPSHLGRVY